MAQTTRESETSMREVEPSAQEFDRAWREGALAGFVAGIGMGLVLHFVLDLMPVIGALVGVESVAVGWVVHLFNSTVFGLLFVAVFDRPFFAELISDAGWCLALGVLHSSALGLITGGLLLPVAMALADATALPIPTLPMPGVDVGLEFAFFIALAHILFGLLLGGAYARLTDAATDVQGWPGGTTDR